MIRTRSSNSTEPGSLSGEGRILGGDLEMDHAISTLGPSQLDGGFAGFQELRGGAFATQGRDPEARGHTASYPDQFGERAPQVVGDRQGPVQGQTREDQGESMLAQAGGDIVVSALAAEQIGHLDVQV